MGVRCVCISLVTRDTDAAIAQLSVIRKDGLQAEASEWSGLGAFKSPSLEEQTARLLLMQIGFHATATVITQP